MIRTLTLSTLALLALSASLCAQGFNVDVGVNDTAFPAPNASFAAGGAQPGFWNAVQGVAGTTALKNLAGAATGVTITSNGGANYTVNNPGTSGDDEAFLDDTSDPSPGPTTWTISGLAAGSYKLYTYAWAPDDASFRSNVHVNGSSSADQLVGGAWSGSYVLGVTHAIHDVTVAAGGSVTMVITAGVSFATLNGFQLVPNGAPSGPLVMCEPGLTGVIACPCANAPVGAGRGCENSSSTGGAALSGSGSSSLAADTLVLATSGEKPTATSIVLQGDALASAGVVFGQGVRCANGSLKRLYTKSAVGGSISAPQGGDPKISVQSSALGNPIAAGQHRWYLVYYRDPIVLGGCPAASTFNATQGLDVLWNP